MEEDVRFGQLAALLAEQLRDPKRKPTPFSPADFFPRLRVLAQASAPAETRQPIDPFTRDPEEAKANSMRMLAKAVDINRVFRGHDHRSPAQRAAIADPEEN